MFSLILLFFHKPGQTRLIRRGDSATIGEFRLSLYVKLLDLIEIVSAVRGISFAKKLTFK
jgi:hypothetical protein